jgi:hypothetical protein
MTKNQKIYWGIASAVVVALLILISYWLTHRTTTPEGTEADETNTEVTSSTETMVTSTTSTVKIIPKTVKTTPPLAYGEMVKKYQGYIFQFDRDCTWVTPTSMVMKKGVKFVIDNRENKTHIFTFANNKYTLKAYNYVIVTAAPVGTNYISCDGAHRAVVKVAP